MWTSFVQATAVEVLSSSNWRFIHLLVLWNPILLLRARAFQICRNSCTARLGSLNRIIQIVPFN